MRVRVGVQPDSPLPLWRSTPGRDAGAADLVPGPRAAQEGGLVGHGLPPHGVQDPVLLKLGDVLQGIPGATAGGSKGRPSAGPVAVERRVPHLSFPAVARAPRERCCLLVYVGPWAAAGQGRALRSLPCPIMHSSRWAGAPRQLLGPRAGRTTHHPLALTPHVGSTTPGWWGPGGTAVVSRA